jgi:hypothetical protein
MVASVRDTDKDKCGRRPWFMRKNMLAAASASTAPAPNPTDPTSTPGRESRASLLLTYERLPGATIIAKVLDPTPPSDLRIYEVDIYPDGSSSCQSVRVSGTEDPVAAIGVAKAEPWIRALLYPAGQRRTNNAEQSNDEHSQQGSWPFALMQRLAGGCDPA